MGGYHAGDAETQGWADAAREKAWRLTERLPDIEITHHTRRHVGPLDNTATQRREVSNRGHMVPRKGARDAREDMDPSRGARIANKGIERRSRAT